MFDFIIGFDTAEEEKMIENVLYSFNSKCENKSVLHFLKYQFVGFVNSGIGPCNKNVFLIYGCNTDEVKDVFQHMNTKLVDEQLNKVLKNRRRKLCLPYFFSNYYDY